MPESMLNVSFGIPKSELQKITATVGDVKTGKTFIDSTGSMKTGTLDPNPTMHITDTIQMFSPSIYTPYLKDTSTYTCGNKSHTSESYVSHITYDGTTRKCSALFNCRYVNSSGFQIYANTDIYASINGSGYSLKSSGTRLITISDTGSGKVEAYIDI